MRTIKITLPDAIANRIEEEAKSVGFEKLEDFIQHELTEKQVTAKRYELEEEADHEEAKVETDYRIERRKKQIANFEEEATILCKVIKEQFPDSKIILGSVSPSPGDSGQ